MCFILRCTAQKLQELLRVDLPVLLYYMTKQMQAKIYETIKTQCHWDT